MLRYRLLLGAIFVVALAALCWADSYRILDLPPGGWLFPLAIVLAVLASGEMLWLFATRDLRPLPWVVYFGNGLIVAANAVPIFWPELAVESPLCHFGWSFGAAGIALLVAFIGEMRRYQQPGQVMIQLGLTVLSFAYVGILLTFAVQLRILGGNFRGMTALASFIAIVKLGDSGAYAVGRLIGRHKMAPVLSPGKTWEGFFGAMIFAILGSWLVLNWAAPAMSRTGISSEWPPLALWRIVVYGLVVGIAGLLGDLAESLIKRDMGRKDSSPWMPGFGGVLDLLDSVLFAAPVAYLCWASGLV
ncbi:MAG: phosphatidate cytidylyltransferase [Pirellulales bacterium]|nr:phosphatidate cytidylyltransferase [Pirellulales bacterium]